MHALDLPMCRLGSLQTDLLLFELHFLLTRQVPLKMKHQSHVFWLLVTWHSDLVIRLFRPFLDNMVDLSPALVCSAMCIGEVMKLRIHILDRGSVTYIIDSVSGFLMPSLLTLCCRVQPFLDTTICTFTTVIHGFSLSFCDLDMSVFAIHSWVII